MLTSKQLGTLTEFRCITYFLERGINVSVPLGENSPYDFIIEHKNHLHKIQCKHSTYKDGTLIFSCETTRINATNIRCVSYTEQDVDFLCTWFNNICYLIPVTECGREKKLRIDEPKNKQVRNINWARDYIAEDILNRTDID